MIQPFAWPLINEHREAGRKLVIATTTPYDLVKPLADWLGFDDLVATRYGVNANGTFDGTIVGPFVWAGGKLSAVRRWAADNAIDLAESFAYSDSVFDTPLLSSVGHPIVVNPDPSMVVVATLRRWPVRHFDVAPGVFKIPVLGIELQRIVQHFARPQLMPYARFDIDGTDNIPKHGPAILVINHRSYFDAGAVSIAIARGGRPVRFLGKKEVFDAPVIGQLATAMGGIPVERASGSNEPLRAAVAAIEAGELVAVDAAGHDPARQGVLRPGAQGSLGGGAPAAAHGRPSHPDRPVGDGEGVAAVEPAAQRRQHHRPAVGPHTRRATDLRAQGQVAEGRHGADHEGDRQAAATGGAAQADADSRGAGGHVSARLQGRPGDNGNPDAESDAVPGTD